MQRRRTFAQFHPMSKNLVLMCTFLRSLVQMITPCAIKVECRDNILLAIFDLWLVIIGRTTELNRASLIFCFRNYQKCTAWFLSFRFRQIF
jgi:hypothetical protein